MQFLNPLFFFGLFALLVPIIIHLFNFRRYKVSYFSNVKLLQNILLKTKRESQIQYFIVLLLRILGITALVFAFTQPYLPNHNEDQTASQVISVYIDNSYSMGALSQESFLLQDAIDAGKNVVNAFDYTAQFILVTNDFSAKEAKLLTKEEMLNRLDEITISPESKNWGEIVAFQQNVASHAQDAHCYNYYISDFQKNQFDFNKFTPAPATDYYLLPIASNEINNIAIDSCWFTAPVLVSGQQVDLTVRVHNYGEQDLEKLPIRLFINGQQRSLATVDLKAGSYSDYQMQYSIGTSGIQQGELQIDDAPVTFDDKLFFTYQVSDVSDVIAIRSKNKKNRYLRALFGRDSLFVYQEMDEDQINYAAFEKADLLILDQLKTISTGLTEELIQYQKQGGNILIFPNKELELPVYSKLLAALGTGNYTEMKSQSLKAGKINEESRYFKGALTKHNNNLNMPTITNYCPISQNSSHPAEVILSLENGDLLLAAYPSQQGTVFLSSIALDDDFGDAHKNAIFIVPLHNIGIMKQLQNKIYQVIGSDEFIAIKQKNLNSEEIFKIRAAQENVEFIPEQRGSEEGTLLYLHNQIENPGFYDVCKGDNTLTTVAFNASRQESNLHYYSQKELQELESRENSTICIIDGNIKNLSDRISAEISGKPLWRWFVILALLCFLGEIVVLRFSSSPVKTIGQ
ncbi:MAG: BatA domain-containing protein [Bacteroidales bacterium]|jgi:hypothetical protein|nr:BatA domain-containing protein [Bacteroidales bacterium]